LLPEPRADARHPSRAGLPELGYRIFTHGPEESDGAGLAEIQARRLASGSAPRPGQQGIAAGAAE